MGQSPALHTLLYSAIGKVSALMGEINPTVLPAIHPPKISHDNLCFAFLGILLVKIFVFIRSTHWSIGPFGNRPRSVADKPAGNNVACTTTYISPDGCLHPRYSPQTFRSALLLMHSKQLPVLYLYISRQTYSFSFSR